MDEIFNISMTQEQVKELCLLLRKNEIDNTKFLNDLEEELESCLFNTMTIDEAEDFFDEKK